MSQQVNRAWTNPKRFMMQLGRTSKFERPPHPTTLLVKAAFGVIMSVCFSPVLRADSPPPTPTVKVAAVQCSSILGGVEANRAKLYAPHKIWALLYPIAWVDKGHPADWFWHTLHGRLAKYDYHVIGANWSVDERQPWRGYGFSTIYAAGGKVLSTAKSIYGDEIVYADLETRPAIAIPAASR